MFPTFVFLRPKQTDNGGSQRPNHQKAMNISIFSCFMLIFMQNFSRKEWHQIRKEIKEETDEMKGKKEELKEIWNIGTLK